MNPITLYFAICRECIVRRSATCWRCGSRVIYPAESSVDADLIMRVVLDGATMTITTARTYRLTTWLAEMARE